MSITALFSKSRIGYIGLDISDTTLEAVQFEGVPGSKSYKVIGWSRVLIPPGIIKHGVVQKPDDFMEEVRKLISRPKVGRLDSKYIVFAVPEHQCYHFNFQEKNISTAALFQSVQKQVIGQVPFQLNQLYWDWDKMLESDGVGYYYGTAIPKDVLDVYMKVFKQLGIRVAVAEPQVHSAARFFWQHLPAEEPAIYIDIGGQETMVATIDDLGVHQSSVVETGTLGWYQEVAKVLQTPVSKAAQVVRTIGLRTIKHPKTPQIHAILQNGLQQIEREATQHLSYFAIKPHPDKQIIKRVIISGGGAVIPGVQEVLSKSLSLSSEQVLPWAQFKPEIQPALQIELAHAIGAAIRGCYTTDAEEQGLNMLKTKKIVIEKKTHWWNKRK